MVDLLMKDDAAIGLFVVYCPTVPSPSNVYVQRRDPRAAARGKVRADSPATETGIRGLERLTNPQTPGLLPRLHPVESSVTLAP